MDSHCRAPKKNTSHGKEVVPQDTTHLIQRPKKFVDRPVKVTMQKAFNSSRGVIRCRDTRNMSELEIRDELKDQGVVRVHRVAVRNNGEVILAILFS